MNIEPVTLWKTEDGQVHATEEAAKQHVAVLRVRQAVGEWDIDWRDTCSAEVAEELAIRAPLFVRLLGGVWPEDKL